MAPASNPNLLQVDTLIPVCAGDLPSYSFTISADNLLEDVVRIMERRPELPGVIILGKQVSVISRAKMFERLGHQYGVELFLRKTVSELQAALKARALFVPAQTRIEEAVRMALARPQGEIYDPVVITDDELAGLRLVDMHVLLLAQSRILSNVANTVGKLEELEKLISARTATDDMLLSALELLSQVVPYHQAAILMQSGDRMEYVARRGIGWSGARAEDVHNIQHSQIFQLMRERREAVCLSDVNTVSDWTHFHNIGDLRSWLGVPLIGDADINGLLSLGRLTHSPFSMTERDTAQVFASRILQTLESRKGPLLKTGSLVWRDAAV